MRLKSVLFYLIPLFILTACGGKEELKIPSDVLTQEQMIKALTKIYLVDGATDHHNFSGGITMPADPKMSYDRFFKGDSITYEEFRKSYDFYLKHPNELSEIYTEVMNELSRLEAVHSK